MVSDDDVSVVRCWRPRPRRQGPARWATAHIGDADQVSLLLVKDRENTTAACMRDIVSSKGSVRK
jgi:hypothetical protein